MDKEHAKFILQSYRPDGADAQDSHFAEALQLAAEDRDLGEWLANERADDAVFANALSTVDIPEGLRNEILAVLEYDQSAEVDTELDGIFFGAVASIQPTSGLRDQILSAMEIELSNYEAKVVGFSRKWVLFTAIGAIAAVLLIGFVSISLLPGKGDDQLALHNIQIQSGKLINASHEMEFNDESLEGVNQWLVTNGLPGADTIPSGLIQTNTKTKGGRKIIFDNGLEASMIYFEKKDVGDFYLMILKAGSVQNLDKIADLGEVKLKRCKTCPLNHFNITSWKDNEKVYMLLSKVEKTDLIELF